MLNRLNTSSLESLEPQLKSLADLLDELEVYFRASRPAGIPTRIYHLVDILSESMPLFRKQIKTLEGEWRNLRALAEIGQVVNSSLELDAVLQIVMDTIIRLTGAERGFLMLRNHEDHSDPGDEMTIRVARNWEQETLDPKEFAVSRTVINRVANEGMPVLTTNAQEDPRFTGQQSVIVNNLRSILCVPLKRKETVIGVIYADNRVRSGLFSQTHLDLLAAFGNQAAVAIDNARLFASVRQTLSEVTELKNLMDNVFLSIASGVITTDVDERIVLCNRAAEIILGRPESNLVGQPLQAVFDSIPLAPYIREVLDEEQTVVGLEMSPEFEHRGRLDLRLNLSPLKDEQQRTEGLAIVIEDQTEKKRLEAQRRLFERMVAPAVIDQLDPNSLQLGGNRKEITTLFADVRGFTSFSEDLSPEELVKVLNRYLSVSAEAVLNEAGTIDKFLGDAIMAWFNAPVPQPDHTLRAVRAALAMREAINCLHQEMPPELHLNFGVGIHMGDAVLGLVGAEKRLDYTAIGDSVNTARRLQENAAAGQILISQTAFLQVAGHVWVRPVKPVMAKGKREPISVYEVLGIE